MSSTSYTLNFAPTIALNAPDDGLFVHHAGKDPLDQIRFLHERGFRAFEDNFLKARPLDVQRAMGAEVERLGMEIGTFVATFDTTSAIGQYRSPDSLSFVSHKRSDREALEAMFREAVEVAKRTNARTCTVLSGRFDSTVPRDYQTARMVENLKRCAEICHDGGLTLGLEPINGRQWPETFCTTIPHAYMMVKAVDNPACKLVFDAYHVQIETGGVIENLDYAWDAIGYVQIADAPGRNEPGTGEMNYRTILQHLKNKGYDALVGVEHGNSQPGADGELATLRALEAVAPV